jgi:hypothetical protein
MKERINLLLQLQKTRHISKECPGRRPSCLCCKAMDHEVLDCLGMISKIEEINMRQENPKADPETKITTKPRVE